MKFTLSFKSPDVLDQLTEDEQEEAKKVIEKYIKWSEYISIEFDTELKTATVLEV